MTREVTTFKQAKLHLHNLCSVWEYHEAKYYEEENGVLRGDATDIPTSKLEESNYKDLRVLLDYFEYEDGDAND